MTDLSGLIPPTVIAAAIIFALKEILEFVRKIRARRRKIKAYKKILSEELERNFWTWKSLRSAVTLIQDHRAEGIEFTHKVISVPSGAQHFEARYPDGTLSSGSNLPVVSRGSFERVLLGLAEEDEKLYSLASDAYDEIAEIGHVRAGLINELGSEEDFCLDGFLDYAAGTIDSAIGPIKHLYRACTGNVLEQPKLR